MSLFQSGTKFSLAILLIILVVLTVVVFFSGLVLYLVKLLNKTRFSSIFQSNRNIDTSNSSVFHRQLQNLFNLHDSGLDQSLIDALPMFIYKDIVDLNGPFDCPVCLCEFSDEHKLRLLPLCKHVFHLHCIDTWLLSNSTCPLCRGTLFNPKSSTENPSFELEDSRNSDGLSSNVEQDEPENIVTEKMVFLVRLGKFKHTNEGDIEMGEGSSINIDTRRCFSMGSVQFVVADTEFQVALYGHDLKASNDGKMITNGNKRESFSVSKVWLWDKKSKIPDDKVNQFSKSFDTSLPNSIQSSTGLSGQ